MRARTVLALVVGFLLIPAGASFGATLKASHSRTSITCEGPVLWHFVHNQVTSTSRGTLTAQFDEAGAVEVESYKQLRSVRHYEIITPTADTLLRASDSIREGNLVLSHTECLAGEPSQECVSGDSVSISWGDVELGRPGVGHLVETASTATSLLPGTYSVALTSTDVNHRAGYQTNQDEEQWYVALQLGGAAAGATPAISDLPEDRTTMTATVGTITLADGADSAVATHVRTGTTNWGSPESVEPTTAVFTCL